MHPPKLVRRTGPGDTRPSGRRRQPDDLEARCFPEHDDARDSATFKNTFLRSGGRAGVRFETVRTDPDSALPRTRRRPALVAGSAGGAPESTRRPVAHGGRLSSNVADAELVATRSVDVRLSSRELTGGLRFPSSRRHDRISACHGRDRPTFLACRPPPMAAARGGTVACPGRGATMRPLGHLSARTGNAPRLVRSHRLLPVSRFFSSIILTSLVRCNAGTGNASVARREPKDRRRRDEDQGVSKKR